MAQGFIEAEKIRERNQEAGKLDFSNAISINFVQKILLVVAYFAAYILMDFEIQGKENSQNIKKGPLLIVANHKGYWDPFLMGLCFPFFSKFFPLRFITKDNFFKNFFTKFIFKFLLGSFPAYKGEGLQKSLEIPIWLLKQGQTVIFFPEGRCLRDEGLCRPKVGVGELALKSPNVPILPVAIAGTHKIGGFKLFIKRTRVRMKVGQPFYLSDKPELLRGNNEKVSTELMEEVEKLYKQIA